jgi:FkbM family methyltransferase
VKSITSAVTSWLKRHPRLYDFVIGVIKRNVLRERSAAYEMLNEFSRSRGGRVSFVQIGANDGLRGDPIREFIVRDPWTGVLIEPLAPVFELLKKNYAWLSGRRSLAFENAAISTSESTLSLFTVANHVLDSLSLEAQLDLLRKSSLHREHLERFVRNPSDVVQVTVPCITVESVVERHFGGNRIDLLSIDAEGHEAAILKSVDFAKTRISAIFCESCHLGDEKDTLLRHLELHGFALREAEGDAFAVRQTR